MARWGGISATVNREIAVDDACAPALPVGQPACEIRKKVANDGLTAETFALSDDGAMRLIVCHSGRPPPLYGNSSRTEIIDRRSSVPRLNFAAITSSSEMRRRSASKTSMPSIRMTRFALKATSPWSVKPE